MGSTLRKHSTRGMEFWVEASYFERTDNTAPNQALHEALRFALDWVYDRRDLREIRARIIVLLESYRHLSRDHTQSFLRDERVLRPQMLPASRSAYRRALPLALTLLRQEGFSLDSAGGALALGSLLVKTDEVFEQYVTHSLRKHVQDPEISIVDGNKMNPRLLFTSPPLVDVPNDATVLDIGKNRIQPDVLLERHGDTCVVLDVKYKPISGHADREDVIEQLVTYAHRLNAPRAVSIHPTRKGQASGLFVSGRVGTTTVYSYRVNIGASDLDQEMRSMAFCLEGLC